MIVNSLQFATSTTASIASTSGGTTGGTNVQNVLGPSSSSVTVAYPPSTASTSAGISGGTNAGTTSTVRNYDDGNDSKLSGGSSLPMSPAMTSSVVQVQPVSLHDVANTGPNATDADENWYSKPRCDVCMTEFDNDAAIQSHLHEHHGMDIDVTLGAAGAGAGAAVAGAAGAGAAVAGAAGAGAAAVRPSRHESANILLSLQTTPDSSRDSSLPCTTSPTETPPPNLHTAASTPPAPTHTPSSLTPTPTAVSTSPAPDVPSTLPSVSGNVDTAGVSSAGAPLSSKSLGDPASSSSSPHHLQPRDTAAASPTSSPGNSRSCSPLPDLSNHVNATGVLIVVIF